MSPREMITAAKPTVKKISRAENRLYIAETIGSMGNGLLYGLIVLLFLCLLVAFAISGTARGAANEAELLSLSLKIKLAVGVIFVLGVAAHIFRRIKFSEKNLRLMKLEIDKMWDDPVLAWLPKDRRSFSHFYRISSHLYKNKNMRSMLQLIESYNKTVAAEQEKQEKLKKQREPLTLLQEMELRQEREKEEKRRSDEEAFQRWQKESKFDQRPFWDRWAD